LPFRTARSIALTGGKAVLTNNPVGCWSDLAVFRPAACKTAIYKEVGQKLKFLTNAESARHAGRFFIAGSLRPSGARKAPGSIGGRAFLLALAAVFPGGLWTTQGF
jgi:hypothetical protein